jgi:hypothetical protein
MPLKNLPLRAIKSVQQIIQPLLTLIDHVSDAAERAVPGQFGERLPSHEQPVTHGTL